MNAYIVGNLVRVSVVFTNTLAAAIDPTGVTLKVLKPTGTITTLTYGTDAALVKDSTGHYHSDIDIDAEGTWAYRWAATGTGQSAAEGSFIANLSPFV